MRNRERRRHEWRNVLWKTHKIDPIVNSYVRIHPKGAGHIGLKLRTWIQAHVANLHIFVNKDPKTIGTNCVTWLSACLGFGSSQRHLVSSRAVDVLQYGSCRCAFEVCGLVSQLAERHTYFSVGCRFCRYSYYITSLQIYGRRNHAQVADLIKLT